MWDDPNGDDGNNKVTWKIAAARMLVIVVCLAFWIWAFSEAFGTIAAV